MSSCEACSRMPVKSFISDFVGTVATQDLFEQRSFRMRCVTVSAATEEGVVLAGSSD